MWGRSTRSRSSVNLPERRRALTGSVSAGNVDLSNWAGNLTGRFIKVLTQFGRAVRPMIRDTYGQVSAKKNGPFKDIEDLRQLDAFSSGAITVGSGTRVGGECRCWWS